MGPITDTPPRGGINKATLVELSLVIVIVGAVAAGTAWATSINHRLDSIDDKLDQGVDDRWRGADMRAWVRQANREVEVWSLEAERNLGLKAGEWHRFEFPSPDDVQGSH